MKKIISLCTGNIENLGNVFGRKSKGQVVTKKPILPTDKETEENPRAKSAKLRVFEKAEQQD